MFEQVRQVVLESGLWDSGEERYKFVLSPSIYEITETQRDELNALGSALYDCLLGLGRVAFIASNPKLCHGAVWGMINRAIRTDVPRIYRDIQFLNPERVPSICKVDLMEGEDRRFYIAEIDGHNKHGLGYSTLAARIRQVIIPEGRVFPGVAALVSQEVTRRGLDSRELVLLYGHQERFYLPEFRIFQNELAQHGVKLIIVDEDEVDVQGNCIVSGQEPLPRLFVDLPFLFRNQELNEMLCRLYRDDKVEFLIPPKPFLGSKTILALLRNDEQNPELESILRSQIVSHSLELLREYIPETYLVSKRKKHQAVLRSRTQGRRFVVKEVISSGMKGVVLPDDPNLETALRRAYGSYYHFVLQEEVVNRQRRFKYFLDSGGIEEGRWYTRITAHYVARRVADLVITARESRRVHGAPDSIQLGAVII